MIAAAPRIPQAMPPIKDEHGWELVIPYEQGLSMDDYPLTEQQVLSQEHARLNNRFTPPPSPENRLFRPAVPTSSSMSPFPQFLLPESHSSSAYPSDHGHQRTSSGGRTSTVSSPLLSTPNTPRLSARPSASHPGSEFVASPINNSPGTPSSSYDVDFATGQPVAFSDDLPDRPLQFEADLLSEDGQLGHIQPTVDYNPQSAPNHQYLGGNFPEPPFGYPRRVAIDMETVNQYEVEGHNGPLYSPYHPCYVYPPPEPSFDGVSYTSDVSSFAGTSVEPLDTTFALPDQTAVPTSHAPKAHGVKRTQPKSASTTSQPGARRSSTAPTPASVTTTLKSHQSAGEFRCEHCNEVCETETRLKKHVRKLHDLPYLCVLHLYGCREVFGTKNEWVRHIRVQHLRLETWRCELGQCTDQGSTESMVNRGAKQTNDYGRKDLFLEHVRRIHKSVYCAKPEGPERKDDLNTLQDNARRTLRSAPANLTCPCCQGECWPDFDKWLEHIAKAMEDVRTRSLFQGFCEKDLQGWMMKEELLELLDSEANPGMVRWRLQGADGKRGGRQSRQRRVQDADTDASGETDEEFQVKKEEPVVKPTPKRASQRRQRKKEVRSRRQQGKTVTRSSK